MEKLSSVRVTVVTLYSIIVLVLVSPTVTTAVGGDCNSLFVESGCSCPEHRITYICAVADDGLQDGTVSTVWRVGVQEIIIPHSQNFENSTGPGSTEHVLGKGLLKTDTCYVSTLTITNISTNFLDKVITCSFDNGSVTIIGETTLSLPTGYSNTITNLSWTEDSDELVFMWSPLEIAGCPSVEYNVNDDGCGSCKQSPLGNVTKCENFRRGQTCTFAVYTDICGNHTMSETLTVMIESSEPGASTSSPRPLNIGGTIGIVVAIIAVMCLITAVVAIIVISSKKKWNICGRHVEQNGGGIKTDCEVQFQRTFSGLNSIQDQPVICIGSEAKIGEAVKVDLIFNEASRHTVSGSLKFESEETDCDVTRIGDYKYQIIYQPTRKGQHQLQIKVDDREVVDSPFNIIVIPPVTKRFTHDQVGAIENVQKPTGVAFNQEGNVIVVDELAQTVSTFNTNLVKIHSFGSPAAGPEIRHTCLDKPRGVAVNESDDIFVVDGGNNCIAVFTSEGGYKTCTRIGKRGDSELQFNDPMGIGINPFNKKIYVTDYGNNRIQVLKVNDDQCYMFDFMFGHEGNGFGEFKQPWGVAFDRDGLVFITDSGNHRIQVFEGDGKFIRFFGSHGESDGELSFPSSIAIDKDGYVYVTEDDNHRISVFTTAGTFVTTFGRKGDQQGQFDLPHGIAIDKDGLNLYVSDHNNHRILVY